MSAPARVRPTQRERREATIARIVDATIDVLGELGYARTTVTEIGTRAGVSQGGIFRHFDTRLDVIAAAAIEVTSRQVAAFEHAVADTDGSVRSLLELTRAATRAPVNAAWQELLTAARTDSALRDRLAPVVEVLRDRIVELAAGRSALRAVPTDLLRPLVLTIVQAFDGEALARSVLPDPATDSARLDLFDTMIRSLVE
ncbi:MAG: TetR/AcrR family transcriptional regulator [Jatrophihabitans sp.]